MTEPANNNKRVHRIRLLVLTHAAATLFVVVLSFTQLYSPALASAGFVLTASQISLIAIWSAFISNSHGAGCVVAFGAVAARLAVIIAPQWNDHFFPGSPPEFLIIQVLFNRLGRFVIVLLVLIALRRRVFTIQLAEFDEGSTVRFQFRLWHLMAVTFLAAIAVTSAQKIYSFFGQPFQSIYNDPVFYWLYSLIFLFVGLIYSLVICLASIWATLGIQRPWLRIGGAIAVVITLSPVWPLLSQQQADAFITQTTITVYETTVLIFSLLVLRSCGYRMTTVSDN